jgi:hypothetical protein
MALAVSEHVTCGSRFPNAYQLFRFLFYTTIKRKHLPRTGVRLEQADGSPQDEGNTQIAFHVVGSHN